MDLGMKTQPVPISPRVGFFSSVHGRRDTSYQINALQLLRPTTGGTEQIQLGILSLSFCFSVVVHNVFGGNWVLAQDSGFPPVLIFQSPGAATMS